MKKSTFKNLLLISGLEQLLVSLYVFVTEWQLQKRQNKKTFRKTWSIRFYRKTGIFVELRFYI